MGMTIVELALAMVVLAIVMLGVIGVFLTLLNSTTRSGDRSAAQLVAQFQLEKVADTQNFVSRNGVQRVYSHGDELPVSFNYQVETSELSRAGEETRAFYVEVTVYWMVDDPSQGRVGSGDKLSVRLGRVVRARE